MRPDEPDFEISESTITGHHPRVDIFTNERRRRVHRWRLVLVSAITLVLVAVGLLSQRTTIAAYLSTRRPTPAPTALPLRLVLNSNVTYGTLTVNGKVVPLGINNPYLPLVIKDSKTTITIDAPPFRSLTCVVDRATLSRPDSPGRCKLSNQADNERVFDMNFTIDDLLPQARQQFDAYLQTKIAKLNALQAFVPAGQHYATAPVTQFKQSIAVARSTLHAHPLVISVIDSSSASSECSAGVCPDNLIVAPNNVQAQSLSYVAFHFHAQIGWKFADGSGHTLATFLSGTPNPNTTSGLIPFITDFHMQIAYDASNGWRDVPDYTKQGMLTDPTLQLKNALCTLGMTSAIILKQADTGASNGALTTFPAYNAPTLSGCVFWMGTNPNGPAGGANGGTDLVNDAYNPWFLVHFGAVMAINPLAHALLPELPMASLAEVVDVVG